MADWPCRVSSLLHFSIIPYPFGLLLLSDGSFRVDLVINGEITDISGDMGEGDFWHVYDK